jgi:hypothetical protein
MSPLASLAQGASMSPMNALEGAVERKKRALALARLAARVNAGDFDMLLGKKNYRRSGQGRSPRIRARQPAGARHAPSTCRAPSPGGPLPPLVRSRRSGRVGQTPSTAGSAPVRAASPYHRALDFGVRASVA